MLALIYSFRPEDSGSMSFQNVCTHRPFQNIVFHVLLSVRTQLWTIIHPIVLYYYMFLPFLAIMQVLNNVYLWRVIVKPAWWWLETTIGRIIFESCVRTDNKYRNWLTNAMGWRYQNLHCVPPTISAPNKEARCFFTTVLPTYHFSSQVGGGMCLRKVSGHVSGCIASNLMIHLRSYKSPLTVVT